MQYSMASIHELCDLVADTNISSDSSTCSDSSMDSESASDETDTDSSSETASEDECVERETRSESLQVYVPEGHEVRPHWYAGTNDDDVDSRWFEDFNHQFIMSSRPRTHPTIMPACELVACLREPIKNWLPLSAMAEDHVRAMLDTEEDLVYANAVLRKFVDHFLTTIFNHPRWTMTFRISEHPGGGYCVSSRSWRTFELESGFDPR